jgi:hypothetical protein
MLETNSYVNIGLLHPMTELLSADSLGLPMAELDARFYFAGNFNQ